MLTRAVPMVTKGWGRLRCPVVEIGLTNDRAPIQQSATLPQAQPGRLRFLSYKLTSTALLSLFFFKLSLKFSDNVDVLLLRVFKTEMKVETFPRGCLPTIITLELALQRHMYFQLCACSHIWTSKINIRVSYYQSILRGRYSRHPA